ncbi:MAG: hypothetical protein H0W78_11270 [Planctomycetes bacterium]|nr:hypothetical protein [Planctomycetota bacterium]
MNTIQSSIDSPSSSFADWLTDAVALVQRVNARLKSGTTPAGGPTAPAGPILRHGRKVLTNQRCLELAALIDGETA